MPSQDQPAQTPLKPRPNLPLVTDYFRDTLKMLLLSGGIGIIVALGAIGFFWLVEGAKHLFLDILAGYHSVEPAGAIALFAPAETDFKRYMLLILPALGGLLSGILVYFLAPDAKGHGTDGVIDAYHHRGGKIPATVPLVKAIASAIIIGSGGSAGKEGPIAQIGAGIASLIARWFSLHKKQVRILMMAGLAAGVGAIFRAPLAAALFAAEVLYQEMDFEEEVIVPAIISSIIAYAIFASQFGWASLFATPQLTFRNPWELIPYTILAIVAAFGARSFIWIFYTAHRWFESLKASAYLIPALGGIGVGCIGFWIPEALYEGYGVVQFALEGRVEAKILAIIVIAKIFTTTFTLASGGSGGIFGPSIVIGGCLGGVVGMIAQNWAPFPLQSGSFVLVGMAGFFSASARVPISSIIMISEITGHYQLLVPTMWVSILAFLLNRNHTLFQKQLHNRFDAPVKLGEMMSEILCHLTVKDVHSWRPNRSLVVVQENLHIKDVLEVVASSKQSLYPLVDKNGHFLGVIDPDEMRRLTHEPEINNMLIASDLWIHIPPLTMEDNLKFAIKHMIGSGHDELFILENQKPVGLISRRDIVDYYDRQMKTGETTTMISRQNMDVRLAQEATIATPTTEPLLSGIFYNVPCQDQQELFEFLANHYSFYTAEERQKVLTDLVEREAVESTAIGEGIAIPHPRERDLQYPRRDIVMAVLKTPIPFNSMDGRPVDIVCLVLCNEVSRHLEAMKMLALAFSKKDLAQKLRNRCGKKEILGILGIKESGNFQFLQIGD